MSRSTGQTFQFVCRQCRQASKKQIVPGRRQFSSTAQKERALPVFKPTSSEELDTLLTTIRHKYFLPFYLNPAQRKLIRSNKLRSQIENDPVYATLGDEEIRLEHIDVTKDMPKRAEFLNVIKLLSSSEKTDWQNLPALLEGYHHSRAKLDPLWLHEMIKQAKDAGALNVVIQCLEQIEKNGFSLSVLEVRSGILLGIREEAKAANWNMKSTKALKRAETVVRHMEHPEHCGSRKVSETDPRAEPYVIAVPLELAAMDVIKNGADLAGKVELYSTRLITALAQQKTALNATQPWQISTDHEAPHRIKRMAVAFDSLVGQFIAVRNALKLTQQIRGSSWADEESAFAAHLQKQIEQKLDGAVAESSKLAQYEELVEVQTPHVKSWSSEKSP